MKQKSCGYTLIEIMVVLGIIGIIIAILLTSASSARKNGRDGERISQIKLLEQKLESYHDQNGVYPATLSALVPQFMSAIPTPPGGTTMGCNGSSNSTNYCYAGLTLTGANNLCVMYHLGVTLETNNSALQNKADSTGSGTACFGSANDFSGSASQVYDVVSPN